VSVFNKVYDLVFRKSALRVFRHRAYAIYLITDFLSNCGQWAFRVGVGWLAWDLTHSGFWLGVVAMMAALPFFTILPIAGAIADRTNKLSIIKTTRSVGIGFTLLLFALTITETIEIYTLCVLTFFIAVNQTFTQPVRMTMAPSLVPPEDIAPAIGINAGMQSSARFIGPTIGGLMIASLGVGSVFILNSFSFAIAVVGLMNIKLTFDERSTGARAGIVADIVEGVRYAFRHPTIGPMITILFVVSISTRAFLELFPGFNDEIFNKGPQGLGTLMSAVGVGGILGSIFISNFSRSKALFFLSFFLMATTACLDILFAWTDSFEIAVGAVVGLGFCITCWQSTTTVLVQTSVEGRMRARVMSIYALTFRACSSLGAMIMGGASHFFGLQKPLMAGGVVALLMLLAYTPKMKTLSVAFEASLAAATKKREQTPN
jgi:predicted MFS family arabinose efflux permease